MEERSYVFSFTFFSLPLIFTLHWWPLAFLILSPLLQNFFVVLSTTKMPPLFFFLRPRSLSPFFSRWASLACRLLPFFPVFLCRTQKQFPLSVFVFIDSLTVSALQDAGGYAIFRQNNLELHLGCHTCWFTLFYIGMPVVRTDGGRSVYGHVITKFLGWVDLLTHGASLARFARESSAIIFATHFAHLLPCAAFCQSLSVN